MDRLFVKSKTSELLHSSERYLRIRYRSTPPRVQKQKCVIGIQATP